ncbi:MAG: YdcF family protein, partial [Oscillospiraceae bacterium]|nr:YdcF family protein [Oscillospiraceae bacterium]
LKIATIVILAAVLALCAAIGIYGAHDTATYNEDVLIVLVAGVNVETPTRVLATSLEKAVEYFNKNKDGYVIVTGGQGPQEDITEAAAMEKYLVESGISDERIIKEEKATSTSENYEYSKEIIDEFFPGGSIVTITNDFHIYRAKKLARVAGIETTTLHASTPKSGRAAMYLREILAVTKVTVFGH